MTIGETLLPEFDQEMTVTRRLLARVPGGKGDWKPHPKSFSLAHLAQLVARMPGWQTLTIKNTELNLGGFGGYSNETTDWLLNEFDKNVGEARAAIAGATDADLAVTWSLKAGDKTLFSAPRVAVVRQNMNHLIHHRGQLTVYLRELDVPIPSIYGPTADEGW
jgi:uncharacterized damage-inducible protein DinB